MFSVSNSKNMPIVIIVIIMLFMFITNKPRANNPKEKKALPSPLCNRDPSW